MSEEITVEQMAFRLGEIIFENQYADGSDVNRLVNRLIEKGVLFEDNHMGNGWQVIERNGQAVIPDCARESVWSSKGYAWAFWMGLGEPPGMRLCCVSWPEVETDAVRMSSQKDFEGLKGIPQLRVVK